MADKRIHVARADLIDLDADFVDFADLDASLSEAAEAATAITILGGYFNANRLIKLCRNVPKKRRAKCLLRIAVGLDAVALLPRIWADLRRVKAKLLKHGFRDVTIAIVRSTPVHFHTKLFYFLKSTRPVWFVGSANPGSDRHELMVNFAGRHEALSKYIDAVFAAATVVDNEQPPKTEIRTLRDFFLTGKLIHKPPSAKTYTFDAYKFSAEDREKLIRAFSRTSGVAHARPTTSGFGFSLRSAMGLDEPSDEGGSDAPDIQRTSSRAYSADTVFGHWVPRKYARIISQQLSEATEQRLGRLTAFAAALGASGGLDKARDEFRRHVGELTGFLRDNNIGALPVTDQEGAFERFLMSRHKLLLDPAARERQARSITIAQMPDIWNDDRAVNAFETSFFEDLAYRAALTGAGRGRIVRSLEQTLEMPLPESAEEIQIALESHLRGWTWLEGDWID